MDGLDSILQRKYTNTNTSDSGSKNTNTKTLTEVQRIAHKLEDTLGVQEQSRFEYYCKVAWTLPENQIWNALESAMKGKDKHRLFSYITTQAMQKAPS